MGRGKDKLERVEDGHKGAFNRETGRYEWHPVYKWAARGPSRKHAYARRLRAIARRSH